MIPTLPSLPHFLLSLTVRMFPIRGLGRSFFPIGSLQPYIASTHTGGFISLTPASLCVQECDGSISIDEGNAAIRDHHQYDRQKYSVYHPQCYSWLYLKRCNFGFYQPRCGEKPPSYF
ncbi:hypothetical protein L2E82_11874 [Cichorium intybus]|uniref:Uncharacterized protein n=1 Tax=Cichorium intybus TaxID=13427 RepID=A0ACB9GFL8_CICIN|nr:hypothetical protein L2E82_11874 [Cichorium intybus]